MNQCVTREELKKRLNALKNITAILISEYVSIGTGEITTGSGAFSVSPDQQCASEEHVNQLGKAFEAIAFISQTNFRTGSFENPVTSCKEVAQQNPNSIPGYHWVQNSTNDAVFVYCTASTQCCDSHSEVGWMRVAYLDMTDPNQSCPQSFRQVNSTKRTCARRQHSAGCSSVTYNTHGINYTKICGRIIGYQYGSPSGFYTPFNILRIK